MKLHYLVTGDINLKLITMHSLFLIVTHCTQEDNGKSAQCIEEHFLKYQTREFILLHNEVD